MKSAIHTSLDLFSGYYSGLYTYMGKSTYNHVTSTKFKAKQQK